MNETLSPLSFTITNNVSGEVTTIILEEDVPDQKAETSPQDTFEVHEYVCSECGKVYKGLRCLHKHLTICGKPKKAANTSRTTRASKRKSDDDDTSTSPEKSTSEEDRPIKKRELGNKGPPEGPIVKREALDAIEPDSEIIEVLLAAEDDANKELCFCCEEPMKTIHTGPVKCKFCKLSFLTYIGRDNHILNMHNSSEEFKCNKCKVQCISAELLEKHQEGHTEFVCGECGAQFHRRYHLDRHKENSKCKVMEKTPLKCDVCEKTFLRLDNLRVHLKGHMGVETRPREHPCTICNKSFIGNSMLLIHMRTHTGERPFPCDLCPKAFPSSGALRKHRRVHTGERPYECSYCHVKFTAKETLNRHIKTHTGQKAYKCEECGVAFIQRTQLKNHMFHHTGEYGFSCPHCQERFDNKPSMTRHVSSKHNLAMKCTTCGYEFSSQEDLENHQEKMHGTASRFICEECCQEFKKKSELEEHLTTCEGAEKVLQPVMSCGVCGKVYKRHDLLVKHERTAHVNDGMEAVAPRKRGRPRKVPLTTTLSSPEVEGAVTTEVEKIDLAEAFNQLKNNNLGASFPGWVPLQLEPVSYRTERALKPILERIMTGLLDEDALKKVGWPQSGLSSTLDQILQVIGVTVDEEGEEDPLARLRNKMMTLLCKFTDAEQMESLMNNYTVDQILHFMAESVVSNN